MSDYEYEEANLDDFMIRAASILTEENSPDYETVVDSLNQHLAGIIKSQSDMDSFFQTLNGVIFNKQTDEPIPNRRPAKIKNKNVFRLYPLIYSFNPKNTANYIDYFFDSLDQSCCDVNKNDFSFLTHIFTDIIKILFADGKKNSVQNKQFIYDKFLNFCNDKIKTNRKIEQSFGCLLLTEFIENCPIAKEEQSIDELFKIISEYLDDKLFECKLDLLNCTISLIFISEQKFRPYANICLFRILDYLTDSEWMKRKLAINIVYTLVCFCKDEILSVKDNIMEFLNILKDDPVEEVKDVCLQTMKYIEEIDPNNAQNGQPQKTKNKNVKNKTLNKSFEGSSKNKRNNSNEKPKTNRSQKNRNDVDINEEMIDDNKNYKAKSPAIKNNNNIRNNNVQNDIKKSPSNINNNQFKETIDNILEQLNKIQNDQNYFLQMINNLQQSVDTNFINLDERIKVLEEKSFTLHLNPNKNPNINQNYNINNKQEEYKNNEDQINEKNGNTNIPIPEKKIERNVPKQSLGESRSNTVDSKEKEKPKNLPSYPKYNNSGINKKEEQTRIDAIKNKFISGRYNEALLESKDTDKYLMKLLPLMDKGVIPRIEMPIIEDVIARCNKKISIICLGEGRGNINDILLFYIQLTKAKINLKLITQLSIKDTLKFLKNKSKNKLIQSDLNNIDTILKSLKV